MDETVQQRHLQYNNNNFDDVVNTHHQLHQNDRRYFMSVDNDDLPDNENNNTGSYIPTMVEDINFEDVDDDDDDEISTRNVLLRMEQVVTSIISALDEMAIPEMAQYNNINNNSCDQIVDRNEEFNTELQSSNSMKKRFTMQQSRSFTSMLLVIAYCHTLLLKVDDNGRTRTTTTREVYYYYVTHFRSQRECDTAIWDVCTLLQVPRHALGLQASSRGWFCGDIQLLDAHNGQPQWNGRTYRGEQGCPISADWLLPAKKRSFQLDRTTTTTATCIVVVEKEGIYQRLVQDGFCYQYNCILVTGKGFPDLATRACVYTLHHQLHLPVYGLADCDPFGVAVLNCYSSGHTTTAVDGATATTTTQPVDGRRDRYSVPMQWLGLRPSQIQHLSQPTTLYDVSYPALPTAVFQVLTDIDRKRLTEHFWNGQHPFVLDQHPARQHELKEMISTKVELEALYWLGMGFCSMFVGLLLENVANQPQHRRDENHNIADASIEWDWTDII